MSLLKFIDAEPNVEFKVSDEAFSNFANQLAEATARRVLAEMNTPDNPLSEKEVCKLIGKTRQTLAKYRKEGKLRYHRIGREIYYFQKQLSEDIKNF